MGHANVFLWMYGNFCKLIKVFFVVSKLFVLRKLNIEFIVSSKVGDLI